MTRRARRTGPGATVALAAFGLAACMGSPKESPIPPEDGFDLGDGKLFVTYRDDDVVAIVDPAKLTVDRLIPVGADPFAPDQPHEAVLGPDGESWFVTIQQGPRSEWGQPGTPAPDAGPCADTDPHCAHMGGAIPGGVERYRLRDNAYLGRSKVGFGAAQMAIVPDGSKMYVSSFDSKQTRCGLLGVVNPAAMKTQKIIGGDAESELAIPRATHGVSITPDGRQVVVAAYWDRVLVIDTATDEVTQIPIGSDPAPIGACDDGVPVYSPNTVAVAPDGQRAYVSLAGTIRAAAAVVAVDLSTREMVPGFNVRTSKGPQQVAVTPDGKSILVVCEGDRALDVIDIAAQARTVVSLGSDNVAIRSPFGIAVHPDGTRAYVAAGCYEFRAGTCSNPRQGAIVEIDLTQDPPVFSGRKLRLGAGVTHVTFGRKKP